MKIQFNEETLTDLLSISISAFHDNFKHIEKDLGVPIPESQMKAIIQDYSKRCVDGIVCYINQRNEKLE